jgi:hypothetical protein
MSSSNGVSKDALANSGTANGLGSSYDNGAALTGSVLSPTLQQMATNPTGYSPAEVADMNTAAMQSYGGAQAGTVGQANLQAARMNNAGGYQAALDDASRADAAGLSAAALGVQNQNANVKLAQQQEGLNGLQSLYGTQAGAGENALGLSDQALGLANTASNSTLNRYLGLANAGASYF